jgi:hypothetical protein
MKGKSLAMVGAMLGLREGSSDKEKGDVLTRKDCIRSQNLPLYNRPEAAAVPRGLSST